MQRQRRVCRGAYRIVLPVFRRTQLGIGLLDFMLRPSLILILHDLWDGLHDSGEV